jgi:hypothetical protein
VDVVVSLEVLTAVYVEIIVRLEVLTAGNVEITVRFRGSYSYICGDYCENSSNGIEYGDYCEI